MQTMWCYFNRVSLAHKSTGATENDVGIIYLTSRGQWQPTEPGCWHFLPTNMLEVHENGSFTLPKAHSRAWVPGSTVLLQILPGILRVFQTNKDSCVSRDRSSRWLQQQLVRVCQVPRSQGYCCSPGWKSSSLLAAAVFPHLLNSDSSEVTEPDPKLSQLRQQNSVLPTLLRSLAPALTPVLLVLLPLICGSLVVAYKVCGARNRAPRSYICLRVCPAMEETITGWNRHRGETDNKKRPVSSKSFKPPRPQTPKNQVWSKQSYRI